MTMGYETVWRKRDFTSIDGGVAYIYELGAIWRKCISKTLV